MTRQFFALLALLSGLAALQAPAQAARFDSLACNVQALSQVAKSQVSAVSECAIGVAARKRTGIAPRPSRFALFSGIAPQPIHIRVDRAHE